MSEEKTVLSMPVLEQWQLIDGTGQVVPIVEDIGVGRSTDNTLCLDDGRISRRHATLSLVDGQLYVEDLGSTNGCLVNEHRIEQKTALHSDDKLSFDTHHYTIQGPRELVATAQQTMISDAIVDEPPVEATAPKAVEPQQEQHAIPNSWVEESCGEGTQLLSMDELSHQDGGQQQDKVQPRLSPQAHLIVLSNGLAQEMIELTLEGDNGLWEIGRDATCQVVIDDPSISSKHAQIIYQQGRWNIANLLSTNGIEHNGQRKLSAFLSDGDHLQLGSAHLVFFGQEQQVTKSVDSPATQQSKNTLLIVILLIVMAVTATLFWLS